MSYLLGIIKAIFESFPAIEKILSSFKKSSQQKVEDGVEKVREEMDYFKKTGRPKK